MKLFYTLFALLIAFLFMPIAAYAADAVVYENDFFSMVVSALPALIEVTPAWVGVLIGVLYAVAHAIALLPTSITANWPSWLKSLINLLAANYGKAKNANG